MSGLECWFIIGSVLFNGILVKLVFYKSGRLFIQAFNLCLNLWNKKRFLVNSQFDLQGTSSSKTLVINMGWLWG